jgi:cell division protein ZapA (FtsZ GTPase activity inhibitor)
MEQLVTIELFGQPYTFKAQSEAEKAREIADILVNEVEKVQSEQKKDASAVTQTATLIIAALNIANENMELKAYYQGLLRDISKRSTTLIRRLDDRIPYDSSVPLS